MTTTKPSVKLICPECQRPNEPERIYCHDCGAKLDRSSLAKVAPKIEDPKQTQKRLKQLVDPGRLRLRLMFFQVSKLLLGACLLAGLIEMFLPPENLPEKQKNVELQQLNLELEKAVQSHPPTAVQFNETQVNAFLINIAKSKQAFLNKYLQFERAIVNFDEGVCQITIERSFMGYSVYYSISYKLENGLTPITNAGTIGRLPIHPKLMQYSDFLFKDLWAALDSEKKLVLKMGGIAFHPKTMTLTPKPAGVVPSV
jgi:hypothetical protein